MACQRHIVNIFKWSFFWIQILQKWPTNGVCVKMIFMMSYNSREGDQNSFNNPLSSKAIQFRYQLAVDKFDDDFTHKNPDRTPIFLTPRRSNLKSIFHQHCRHRQIAYLSHSVPVCRSPVGRTQSRSVRPSLRSCQRLIPFCDLFERHKWQDRRRVTPDAWRVTFCSE